MQRKIQPYLLNLIIFTGIFIFICLMFDFVPFGSETMLTVDLGQQYIDFFSQFKDTLLNHPTKFFYSFEKGFGGEMVGLWAYYLMSPFNLILLFFNEGNFDIAVTLLTYLKLLSASLTFMLFSRHVYKLETPISISFSLAYALMSYVIVYLLNIMWLDGLVFLPLIALGLHTIVEKRQYGLYVVSLAVMLVANYYIGYMICLFLAFYALFVVVERQEENARFNLKQAAFDYGAFVRYSIYAVLIAGIMLFPTIDSLSIGKGTHQSLELTLDAVHNLADMMSKSFIGSFNFDEMSSGSPNIFAGMLVLLLSLSYFFQKRIHWREKLVALFVLAVFFVSFRYELINKLWHGGQFPIWYHFRFSFTTSFFLIVLAIRAYTRRVQERTILMPLALLGLMGVMAYYYLEYLADYEFLSDMNIFISLIFFVGFLLLLQFQSVKPDIFSWFILAFVIAEMTSNAGLILSEMSYVDQSKFRDYTQTLDEAVGPVRHGDETFYRTNKTFMRTKNEAMYSHYHGLDHFGSTIEAHVPELFGYLGMPDGNGFVAYTNGTLLTDDFFNVRYHLDVTEDTASHTADDEYVLYREATDLDNEKYSLVSESDRYLLRENEDRLGFGIEMKPELAQSNDLLVSNDPIGNHEKILELLDFTGDGSDYFVRHTFDDASYHNVRVTDTGDGDYYTYVNDGTDEVPGYVELTFSTDSENPYYFTLPSQLDNDAVSLQLNHVRYRWYTPYRRRQVVNASYGEAASEQTFRFYLEEDEMTANLIYLYEFDEARYDDLIASKQDHLFEVSYFNHNEIVGTIETELAESQVLFTVPFDDNWSVTVDGESVEPVAVLNETLLAVPVTEGSHEIRLVYFPHGLYVGMGTMVLGIGLAVGEWWLRRRGRGSQSGLGE